MDSVDLKQVKKHFKVYVTPKVSGNFVFFWGDVTLKVCVFLEGDVKATQLLCILFVVF